MQISEEKRIRLVEMYNGYVKEAATVSSPEEMRRFAARKTLSSTMMESERTNETKVMDALKGSDYVEGDRLWTFYLPDNRLCLIENFSGEYNKPRLYKNIFDTAKVFDGVIPVKEMFLNYALKKNLPLVETL